jgi:hypothetical protein
MKKMLVCFAVLAFILMSCNRGMSPYQAANKHNKCGRGFMR